MSISAKGESIHTILSHSLTVTDNVLISTILNEYMYAKGESINTYRVTTSDNGLITTLLYEYVSKRRKYTYNF